MGLQDAIRLLLPREDKFYTLLERQGVLAHQAAVALARFADGDPADDVAKAVQALEHEADAIFHQVEEQLAKTFVTPIDREDIQALSSMLDTLADRANLIARCLSLYAMPEATEPMKRQLALFVRGTAEVKDALPFLRKTSFDQLREAVHRIRDVEKEGDGVFRSAIGALFRDEAIGVKALLREKELLEQLESAVDQCEDVGDFLTNLAVKHG